MAAPTSTLTKIEKREIKNLLTAGVNGFLKDPGYPLDDLGKKILIFWSKDIDNYYDLIINYLVKNPNPNDRKVSDVVIKGVFPYVMAFQEFFTLHQLKSKISEECKKNNKIENLAEANSSTTDIERKIGPILYEQLQNGKTYKLSDGYCYDLMELYGISKQSPNPLYKSPLTRQDLKIEEQVFLMFLKTIKDYKINELANMPVQENKMGELAYTSTPGGSKNNKSKRSNKTKNKNILKSQKNKALLHNHKCFEYARENMSNCLSCCSKKRKTKYMTKKCLEGCRTYEQREKNRKKFKKDLRKFVRGMEKLNQD